MPTCPRRRPLPLLVLLAAAAAPAPAPAQLPPLPGTQPGEIVSWPLVRPASCLRCHQGYDPAGDYEPGDSWAGSMMANAARDPLLWAALDVANQDRPGTGELCIRCHAPQGWLEGRSTPPDGSALQGSPGSPGGDYEGLTCDVCHRVHENPAPPPGQQPFYTGNAQMWIDDRDSAPGEEPFHRGPYDDVVAVQHPWLYDRLYTESRYCGLCHDVTNPLHNLRDELGADTGVPYPIERTYREWTRSAFADPASPSRATCQDCHMPPATGWACSDQQPLRSDVHRHDWAGGNAWMPLVLASAYPGLGRDEAFAAAAARARDMLETRSARVELAAPATAPPGGDLDVVVRATNLTGHKLPTGYPEGRRMWLQVEVTDAARRRLHVSGDYDAGTATLAADSQLKVYEALAAISGVGPTFHFVLNDSYALDNRIPPQGFVPDVETRPWGYVYPDLGGGVLAHWDDTPYRFALPAAPLYPLTVRATLLYQTASREYVEFLRDENRTSARGQEAYDLWAANGMSPPVAMGTATATVGDPVPSLPPFDVGNVLRLAREGAAVRLRWDNAPVGGLHDPATWYEVHETETKGGPWNVRLPPVVAGPAFSETLDPALAPPPVLRFYSIVSWNSGGSSPPP